MLIGLLDKLIDRVIQLVNHQKSVKEETIKEFVEPLFHEFEEVHQEYIQSFQKYKNIIRTTKEDLNASHSIFSMIKDDSLLTQGQRSKVKAFSEATNDIIIGEFVKAISNYLTETNKQVKHQLKSKTIKSNILRGAVYAGLNEIFLTKWPHGRKKVESIERIDNMIWEIQRRYKNVVEEYASLKKTLLR